MIAAARLRLGLRRHTVLPAPAASGLNERAETRVAARVIAAARLRLGLRRHAVLPEAAVSELAVSERAGFGLKERAWNDKALLRLWRERWAEMANARLAELGHDVRIDHRSHAARGLDLEPQNKIGPAGARRARRGEEAERADEHRAIARRNGERLLAQPELALRALTHQQSTFTRQDLARLIHRQTDGAEQFAAVMAKVEASPERVAVGTDGRGRERFSTREMAAIEDRLVATAIALNRRTTHRVNAERRAAVVDGPQRQLNEEQRLAYLHVTRSRDLAVVVGIAGGGKSTMLGPARAVWEGQGYRVRGAALSGIAAEGLEGSAGIESRTIASWEYAWNENREVLTASDVLVVDEAGMIGSRQLGRLVARVQQAGAKLVLVGDAEQLQAIEAGAAFRAIAERVGVMAITEPQRQLPLWQRQATKELATARTAIAIDRYEEAGLVHRHATREMARAGVIAAWQAAGQQNPDHSQLILAHERVDVQALNEAARAVRRVAGELGPDQLLQTEAGPLAFAEGDRVYFLRNERSLGGPGGTGVKNGTLGTLMRIAGSQLTVRLDPRGPARSQTAREVVFDLAEYADIGQGYAATIHRNQGATVDQAHVLATPGMDRHLVYVAMSRHRHVAQLHWSEEDFRSPESLRERLGRERAKDTTLDYADPIAAYAERRGLHPRAPASEIVVGDAVIRVIADMPLPRQQHRHDVVPGVADGTTDRLAPELPSQAIIQTVVTPMLADAAAESEAYRIPDQPMLPAIPYRSVSDDEVAAIIDADARVRSVREELAALLDRAYRDPAKAAQRLHRLERDGGAHAAAERLAQRPALLGGIRKPGWLSREDRATAFALATVAAQQIGPLLARLRDTETDIGRSYRRETEPRRQREAQAVPGLSATARSAIDQLAAAGAAPDHLGPAPWDHRAPTAVEIRDAARLAPIWASIMADQRLEVELTQFMTATHRRLPPNPHEPLSAAEHAAGQIAGMIYSGRMLAGGHASFQAYVADEPRRQAAAQAAREAQQREAARIAQEALAIAARQVDSDARLAAKRRRDRDAPGPAPRPGPGIG